MAALQTLIGLVVFFGLVVLMVIALGAVCDSASRIRRNRRIARQSQAIRSSRVSKIFEETGWEN